MPIKVSCCPFVGSFLLGAVITVLVQFIMQSCGIFQMQFNSATVKKWFVSDPFLEMIDISFCRGDGIPTRERNRIFGGQPVNIEEVPWAVVVMINQKGGKWTPKNDRPHYPKTIDHFTIFSFAILVDGGKQKKDDHLIDYCMLNLSFWTIQSANLNFQE